MLRSVSKIHDRDVTCVAVSRELALVATGSADFSVRLWDLAFSRPVGICSGHTSEITSLAFVASGASRTYPLLLSADSVGNVMLWGVCVRPSAGRTA